MSGRTSGNPAATGGSIFGTVNLVRNNSMAGAVNGTPGTLPTNWNYTALPTGLTQTLTRSTQNEGPFTVDILDVNLAGTTSSTSTIGLAFESATQIVAATAQTWSMSVWISTPVDHAALTTLSLVLRELTSGGVFVNNSVNTNVYSVRATFARRPFTGTLVGGGTVARVQPVVVTNSIASGTAINLTLRFGWPQIEQAAATSAPKVT